MTDIAVLSSQVIGGVYGVWVAVGSVPELRAVLDEQRVMLAGVGTRLWRPVWQRLHLSWSWLKAHALRPFGLDVGVTGTVHATGPAGVGSGTGQGSGHFGWTGIATGYSSMEGRVALIEEALDEVRSRFDSEREARVLRDEEVSASIQGLRRLVDDLRVHMQAQAAQSAGRALSLLPYAVWAVILTTAPDRLAALPVPVFIVIALAPPLVTLAGAAVRHLHTKLS